MLSVRGVGQATLQPLARVGSQRALGGPDQALKQAPSAEHAGEHPQILKAKQALFRWPDTREAIPSASLEIPWGHSLHQPGHVEARVN